MIMTLFLAGASEDLEVPYSEMRRLRKVTASFKAKREIKIWFEKYYSI